MKRRQGFTLVELLVSMALIIFIMAILSQAFQAALSTFRNLKAEGDMAEKLRAVTQLLQRDLAADHFEGKKRLSNPNFWLEGPPSQGYFRVWQGGAGNAEGVDVDGIGSYRSVNHMLAFTAKLRGNDMGSFFSASVPATVLTASLSFGPPEARYQNTSGGSYNYQWADVAWFMQPQINPNTQQQDTSANGTGLYTLYRRQCLLVPDNSLVPTQTVANVNQNLLLELSCWNNGGNWYFNSPMDITVPWRRFGMVPLSTYPSGLLYGVPSSGPPPTYPSPVWPYPPPPGVITGNWFAPSATPPLPPTYSPPLPPAYVAPLIPYYPTLAQQVAPGTLSGADIQLNDVVSFDVRLLVMGITPIGNDPFVTLFTAANPQLPISSTNQPVFLPYCNPNQAQNPGQAFNPAFNIYTGPMVFDTWSSLNDSLANYTQWNVGGATTSIPLWNGTIGPIITAIQVSIRIWDYKTNQTRQVTIVQAM